MRKGVLLALLLCFRAFGQDAAVEGVTVDSSTGRPLPGVHIRVFNMGANNNVKSYGALSDAAGRFSIAKIPPGSYFCLGERTGYLTLRKVGGAGSPLPSIVLKPGERTADYKLEMTPRATISGRVLDEYGDPVQHVQVQATPVSPDAPVATSFTGGAGLTDERGEYHLPAGPGTYRVRAILRQMNLAPEIRTDGTSAAEYLPTDSRPVEVAAGAEVNGIDIQLSRRAAPSSAAEGTVTGIPDSFGSAVVYLLGRDAELGANFQELTQTSSDGRFYFRNLRPGSYRMFARYTLQGKALASQTVEFTGAAPPSGVVLRLAPAADVTGTISFDGGELPPARRTVTLRPVDAVPMTSAPTGEIDGSHEFRIAGVFAGRYRVAVQPLPANAYVRAVEVDGAAAPEDLELSGASRLKVAIGRNAPQVAGNVVDRDGSRLQNTMGAVLLIRDLSRIELNEDHLARVAPDGSYTFKGLRPGKYWLLAIDAFRSGDINRPDQLKKHAALAEPVELKEGDRLRKDLTIVTKEALDAKGK